MADYEVPTLTGEGYCEVPAVREDVMKGKGPFIAKPAFQEAMHFPSDFAEIGELVPNWKERALDKMADLKGRYRSLQVFLDICVKCGAYRDCRHTGRC